MLHLPCAERTVGVEAALRLPDVMVLVVEDTCAVIALRNWARREPPIWRRRARRCWHAEGRRLRAEKARVKDLAARCLDEPA
ncbi:hypothetical protein [Streptomyces sp. TRM68416]|uniref:hypothetical protein n=1 Tax=Streptomyces sp. TRM68416 TaxID=2758412 RepID=UPI001661F6B2|nr:hypothetical protein [Streptomyces sp. TRM68416]MBD0842094.1 hypothetical protein [Streptomyces sp. TRM68416]